MLHSHVTQAITFVLAKIIETTYFHFIPYMSKSDYKLKRAIKAKAEADHATLCNLCCSSMGSYHCCRQEITECYTTLCCMI